MVIVAIRMMSIGMLRLQLQSLLKRRLPKKNCYLRYNYYFVMLEIIDFRNMKSFPRIIVDVPAAKIVFLYTIWKGMIRVKLDKNPNMQVIQIY